MSAKGQAKAEIGKEGPKEAPNRRNTDDAIPASTRSSTNVSKETIKKSASFAASNSREPLQEQLILANDLGKDGKPNGRKINPAEVSDEESISISVTNMLKPYAKCSQTVINEKVSQLYDLVGRAVDSVLAVKNPLGVAELTGFKVSAVVTVNPITAEENHSVSPCSMSPTPEPTLACNAGIEKQSSVETNKSAPSSASSHRSVNSPRPDSSKKPDSANADDSAERAPAKKASIQKAWYIFNDETELEVICGCQLSPLIHDNTLFVPVQRSTTGNDTLKSYNLVDGKEFTQEVKRGVSYTGCKMFYFKNASLAIPSSSTRSLRLYQFDAKSPLASWELIPCPTLPLLDPKNSFVIPFKDNEVIVISIVNQQATSQIKFYILSQSLAKNLRSASSNIRYSTKYQIQSCAVLLNCIYCGLLLPDGAYIYKFDIASLPKGTHDIPIEHNRKWYVRNFAFQSFFISKLGEDVFLISVSTNDNKSIVQIRRLLDSQEIPSVDYQFKFPCVVKVVAATIIPGYQNPMVTVMYHSDMTGKCHVKRVFMLTP